ncbi:hypothetical protein GF377_04660 [candidate division GN15 bacterium]|nr:hypothetical protein [candidate division GN15 bacterium]
MNEGRVTYLTDRPWRVAGLALTLLLALVLTSAFPAVAQETPEAVGSDADTVRSLPGIEIETSVDKADVYIGDLITYKVTIRYDTTRYTLVPPPLGANLGAFDVKDYQPDVVTELDGDRVQSQTTFVLSTFTTGEYTIPPLPVIFELPDETRKLLLAEPVPINVASLLANAGDSVDIKPLKEPYAYARDYTLYYVSGAAGLGLLIIALVIWLWLRRRKKQQEYEDLRPPWEKAFERLAYLQHEDLPGKEEYKDFYVRLTEIARWYLEHMYDVNALEMTTEQFVEGFSDIEMPDSLYDELVGFLRHADMVKFARFTPDRARPNEDFAFVHGMIEKVRADVQRREQEAAAAAKARLERSNVEEAA